MYTYFFLQDKTAMLGAIKAQLLFSQDEYQLLNSWNKIPFPTSFYHLFELSATTSELITEIMLGRTNTF